MKEKVEKKWPGIDFHKNVRLVFTIPAEFDENSKTIMRQCIYNAGLIKRLGTLNLQFTTEPEAASIHCMNMMKELNLTTGATYLVVDCGGGTIDLTMRELVIKDRIAETTERTGDFCGSTYVDDEFLKFIESKVGKSAMKMLKEKHYDQINYMIHKFFCPEIKLPFTGERSGFKDIEFDIEKKCPALMKYVSGSEKAQLKKEEWVIDIDFDTVVSFFDPVVNNILKLIDEQLTKCPECSVLFLVGGFGESKYLQSKVRQSFEDRLKIEIPPNPATAIVKGACQYGLDMKTVSSRVLKWTYGIEYSDKWKTEDPISRKTKEGRIFKFHCMAIKGTSVDVNKEFTGTFIPARPDQTYVPCDFFYTPKYFSIYCDEPEMKKLGGFKVSGLPTADSELDRTVKVSMIFASMENTVATARSNHNGEVYRTVFTNKEHPF